MTRIELPASVDLPAAAIVADALRGASDGVEIGAADVARIGLSGLQVLMSAAVSAKAGGRGFRVDRPTAAFAAAVRTAGADALLAPAD